VILAESKVSFPAGSQEQFYVSASRGRQKCTVYTDDAELLKEAIATSSVKLSATELMESGQRRRRIRHQAMIAAACQPAAGEQVAAYGR
jgi:hypothetical protein